VSVSASASASVCVGVGRKTTCDQQMARVMIDTGKQIHISFI
jgi:hypothetical protein